MTYPLEHKIKSYPVPYIPSESHADASKFRERQQERLKKAQNVVPIRRKA